MMERRRVVRSENCLNRKGILEKTSSRYKETGYRMLMIVTGDGGESSARREENL
jgi:hypothetical protein